jgi:hypothetical protein
MKALVLLLMQFAILQAPSAVQPFDSVQGLVVTLNGTPIPNAKVTATPDGKASPDRSRLLPDPIKMALTGSQCCKGNFAQR